MTTIPFPAIPYPPSAVQHTHALLALTSITACMDVLKLSASDTSIASLVDQIREHIKGCRATVRNRRLSSGAKRDLDKRFRILGASLESRGLSGDALFRQWAVNVWCSLTLIESANITCPVYCHGQSWRGLQRVVTELATKLVEMCPGAEDDGTELYMRVG